MRKNQTAQTGIIHYGLLLLVGVIAVFFVVTQIPKTEQTNTTPTDQSTQTESPQPSATIAPTQEPTPAPTPTPTPVRTSTPTPLPATPKPTAKPVSGPPGSGHSRITVATERGNFTADIISIDMGGVRMITDTGNDGDCGNDCATLSLADFVGRNGGFAGINGTYFCPPDYPACSGKKNSYDFPVYNTRLGKWINQGNLFWNDRSIIYQDGGGMHFMRNASSFGGGLSAGIVNSPGLLDGGGVIADQFPLSDQQRAKGTRGGIGIRGNVVYLVVARSADMIDFAHVFKSLGATHALNLDGGGSTALWFGGYKLGPGRSLPNAVIFAR